MQKVWLSTVVVLMALAMGSTSVSAERLSLSSEQTLSQIAAMADRMLSFESQQENDNNAQAALEPESEADSDSELPPRLIKEQSSTGPEKDQTPDLELKHMLHEADEMGKELTKMDAHHDMLAKQLEIATAKQDHSDIKATIANVVTTALARRSEQRQREIADIVDKVVSKLKVRLNACNKANKAMKREIEEENEKRGANATMPNDEDAEASESSSASETGATGADADADAEAEAGGENGGQKAENSESEGESSSESSGEAAATGGAAEGDGANNARFKGESEIVKAEAEREEDERIEREAHEELAAEQNHSPKLRRLHR